MRGLRCRRRRRRRHRQIGAGTWSSRRVKVEADGVGDIAALARADRDRWPACPFRPPGVISGSQPGQYGPVPWRGSWKNIEPIRMHSARGDWRRSLGRRLPLPPPPSSCGWAGDGCCRGSAEFIRCARRAALLLELSRCEKGSRLTRRSPLTAERMNSDSFSRQQSRGSVSRAHSSPAQEVPGDGPAQTELADRGHSGHRGDCHSGKVARDKARREDKGRSNAHGGRRH